jgi:hypothetical protein
MATLFYIKIKRDGAIITKELQEELVLAFCQEDKTLLEEFIDTYSPYDELKAEYHSLPEDEFKIYFNQAIKEYMG